MEGGIGSLVLVVLKKTIKTRNKNVSIFSLIYTTIDKYDCD